MKRVICLFASWWLTISGSTLICHVILNIPITKLCNVPCKCWQMLLKCQSCLWDSFQYWADKQWVNSWLFTRTAESYVWNWLKHCILSIFKQLKLWLPVNFNIYLKKSKVKCTKIKRLNENLPQLFLFIRINKNTQANEVVTWWCLIFVHLKWPKWF